MTHDPEFDTSSQRWFYPGYPMEGFLSQADAKTAAALAEKVADARVRLLAEEVRRVLP